MNQLERHQVLLKSLRGVKIDLEEKRHSFIEVDGYRYTTIDVSDGSAWSFQAITPSPSRTYSAPLDSQSREPSEPNGEQHQGLRLPQMPYEIHIRSPSRLAHQRDTGGTVLQLVRATVHKHLRGLRETTGINLPQSVSTS